MNDHVDMSQFIAARSDQLNADDLLDGPRTITITKVTASPDAAEQPVSIHYDGDGGKPFKPCKTVRRIMVGVWGKDASKYIGRSMTLFRDPAVSFGGMQVGGIRVSHMSDIDEKKTVALQVTRGRKAPYSVMPLKVQTPAPATGDDAAAKWANAFIAKLAELPDTAAVDAFEAEKSAKLAELKTARPKLHANVVMRILARKGELAASASFEDDLVSEPEQPERPAEQPGEVNDQAPAEKSDAEKAVDDVIAKAQAAKTPAELQKLVKDTEQHKIFMPEDQQVRLEIAFDQARVRLEKAEEPAT